MSSTLPLTWKVTILLKQRSTQWGGNVLQITMFYKKTNDNCCIIEKPTTTRIMINGEWKECSVHKKLHFPIGMGNTQLIWKITKERGKPQDQSE
jgi:hypothetical protein